MVVFMFSGRENGAKRGARRGGAGHSKGEAEEKGRLTDSEDRLGCRKLAKSQIRKAPDKIPARCGARVHAGATP